MKTIRTELPQKVSPPRVTAAALVKPSKKDIATYVRAMFKRARSGGYVAVLSFAESGATGEPKLVFHKMKREELKSLSTAIHAVAMNAAATKEPRVCCVPTATFASTENAKASNVAEGLVLSVDLDHRPLQGLKRLQRVLGAPTLVMQTGGVCDKGAKPQRKRHVHYRLKKPARTDEEKALLLEARRLAAELAEGDTKCAPLSHGLRVPSVYRKGGGAKLCKLEEVNGEIEIDLRKAVDALRKAVAKAKVHQEPPPEEPACPALDDGAASKWAANIANMREVHDSVRNLAMSYAGRGIPREAAAEALKALMHAARARDTGDPERWTQRFNDISRLVESAYARAEQEAPWPIPDPLPTLPPVQAMTPDMLPEKLRPWLVDVSHRMQVPLEFVAGPAVIAAAMLVGGRVNIQPKALDTNYRESANLWGFIVGQPGVLKSPAVNEALVHLRAFEQEAQQENAKALSLHAKAKHEYETRRSLALAAVKKRKGKEGADEEDKALLEEPPAEPNLERYIIINATKESLLKAHADNPNGLLVHHDELATFLTRLEDKHAAEEREVFLQAWGGDQSYSVDRITRAGNYVSRLRLSVIGTTQPQRITPLVQSMSAKDGMLQRFQLAFWPDSSTEWRDPKSAPNLDAHSQAQSVYSRLRDLTFADDGKPRILRFSPKAQKRFDEWQLQHENRVRSNEMSSVLCQHVAKYRGLVPRLSLVFRMIDGGDDPIKSTHINMAIAWARLLETHAQRLYGAVIRQDVADAERIVKAVIEDRLGRSFTQRDVHVKVFGGKGEAGNVTKALAVVEGCSIVRRVGLKTGGRGSVLFTVNPLFKEGSGRRPG